MKVTDFGATVKGDETKLYTLTNKNGMEIAVSDYGATLVQVIVPDKEGKPCDVVLGYDEAAGYEEGDLFFGAIVGRSANRIGGASFELNGVTYQLEKNDNGNNLHSGMDFYNQRMWKVKETADDYITFELDSPDGDQGYPGAVHIEVTYTLTEDNAVKIAYHAVPDADTLINMTNHSYFNMDGHASGDVLDQEVWIDADAFTRADAESIPTGEITPVEGTPMDFRTKKAIGKEIETGMKLITTEPMDFRNTTVVGLAVAVGMGVTQASASLAQFPDWVTTIFGKSPVVLATIVAIVLNLTLPKAKK